MYSVYIATVLAQTVKSLPEIQETWVPPLGQEDPLENRTAIHQYSSLENSMNTRAWRVCYSSLGHKELNTTEQLTLYISEKQGFTVYHREFYSKPHNNL